MTSEEKVTFGKFGNSEFAFISKSLYCLERVSPDEVRIFVYGKTLGTCRPENLEKVVRNLHKEAQHDDSK